MSESGEIISTPPKWHLGCPLDTLEGDNGVNSSEECYPKI